MNINGGYMEYKMNVYPIFVNEDSIEWSAEFPDLIGCVGGGSTPEEAVREAIASKEIYLEFLKEQGIPIPLPSREKNNLPSGRISLRISKSMHKRLLELSEEDGVSLNSYINNALNEKIGVVKSENRIKQILGFTATLALKPLKYKNNDLGIGAESWDFNRNEVISYNQIESKFSA